MSPNDVRLWIVRLLAATLVCVSLLYGCSSLNRKAGFKDDNIIEETLEKQLERYLNHDIDLTPLSPE